MLTAKVKKALPYFIFFIVGVAVGALMFSLPAGFKAATSAATLGSTFSGIPKAKSASALSQSSEAGTIDIEELRVYRASFSGSTEDLDDAAKTVRGEIKKYGGLIVKETLNSRPTGGELRMTARIPVESFPGFYEEFCNLPFIDSCRKDADVVDITLSVTRKQILLNAIKRLNASAERLLRGGINDRSLELYMKIIDKITTLQQQLSYVEYQEAKALRAHKYASVNIYIYSKKVAPVKYDFAYKLKQELRDLEVKFLDISLSTLVFLPKSILSGISLTIFLAGLLIKLLIPLAVFFFLYKGIKSILARGGGKK